MPSAIASREPQHFKPKIASHLREAVFGFNDGIVSTFAVVAGLFGGAVMSSTILLAALATLVGGAFSMGLGTYLGNKSERDLYLSEVAREKREMKEVPEIERQEIREIYSAKGFKGDLLEKVVTVITSDDKLWLETMMREELGFGDPPDHPIKYGLTMSASFTIGSLIATAPYFFAGENESLFYTSMITSLVGLVIIGWFKTYFTQKHPLVSIVETLIVALLASGGAFGIGLLI